MIYTNSDGGCRGNPGPGAIGVIIRRDDDVIMKYAQKIGNFLTNNICEYEALIKALELAKKVTDKEVTCILDSELVVKQLLGEYKVRNHKLLPLFLKVHKLIDNFEKVSFKHASRWDDNQQLADEILNKELEKHGHYKKFKKRK
jgi:ribonuclease HI